MIEKFEDYLGNLPLTNAVKGRINEVLLMNSKIIDFEIQDIFVCEFKNDEGSRNFTSLWLFSEKFCIECKNFLNSNNFDLTPLKELDYCSIFLADFDFEETGEKSFVKIHFRFKVGLTGDLIATESNCLSLFEIYKKYLISNLDK